MAAANAAVLSVFPSALAPKVVTSKLALGNDVGTMPLTIACACGHGRSLTDTAWPAPAAGAAVPARAVFARIGAATAAPATAAPIPIACRRENLSAISSALLVAGGSASAGGIRMAR